MLVLQTSHYLIRNLRITIEWIGTMEMVFGEELVSDTCGPFTDQFPGDINLLGIYGYMDYNKELFMFKNDHTKTGTRKTARA